MKRVEFTGESISVGSAAGSLTVLSHSRITHEEGKALEERLLAFVQTKRSISRSDGASYFQISDDQAYRLLQRLVGKGKLRKIGRAGRFVRYGFPS